MRRRWLYLFAVTTAIVVVTFPWDLKDHAHWQKVTWVPFTTGIVRSLDLVANVALYLPLGFLLPSRSPRLRLATALAVALMLSTIMELTQVWSHIRFPSATDVLMNSHGALLGAALSWQRTRAERSRVAA